jgi:hypothetical protein
MRGLRPIMGKVDRNGIAGKTKDYRIAVERNPELDR